MSTAFLTYDINKANREIPQFFFSQNPSPNDAGCSPTCTGSEAYNFRVPFQVVWQHGNPVVNTNNKQIGAYLQDDWSPTPRLTINLGIRWDVESHMYNYDYVTPSDVRGVIDSVDHAPVRTQAESLVATLDTTNYFNDGTQRKKFYGAFQPRIVERMHGLATLEHDVVRDVHERGNGAQARPLSGLGEHSGGRPGSPGCAR